MSTIDQPIGQHLDSDERKCWRCKFYGFKARDEGSWVYCSYYEAWFDNPFAPPEGADLAERKMWNPPGLRSCEAWELGR